VLPVLRCTIARAYLGGTGRIAVNFEDRLCCGSLEAWVVVPRVVRAAGALRYVQRVLAIMLEMCTTRSPVSRIHCEYSLCIRASNLFAYTDVCFCFPGFLLRPSVSTTQPPAFMHVAGHVPYAVAPLAAAGVAVILAA
jgi:hypothetical protein